MTGQLITSSQAYKHTLCHSFFPSLEEQLCVIPDMLSHEIICASHTAPPAPRCPQGNRPSPAIHDPCLSVHALQEMLD